MAFASARTSPDSKAAAKLISNSSYQRTFWLGWPTSWWGGKGPLCEIRADDDGDTRTAGWRRDRRHHRAEVALQPGHGRCRTATGAVQDLGLRHPPRGGRPEAGVPSFSLEQGGQDAGGGPDSVRQPVAAASILEPEGP